MSDTERSYDVAILGLGAMGTSTAWHLARRGASVLGLERFEAGHSEGSSHGESRMVREIYYEAPLYVPILRRAFELWRELEGDAGTTLLHQVGGLMVGAAGGTLIRGARRTALEHAIPAEVLSPEEIRARFGAFDPQGDVVGVWDPRAGYVRADACVRAMREGAIARGADLRYREPVTGWSPDGAGVTLRTERASHRADRLVIAAGPWTRSLLPELDLPLRVERQVLWWFRPVSDPAAFAPDRCPVYLAEYGPDRFFYGFPRLETGVKTSIFHQGETHARPEEVRRDVSPEEVEPLRAAMETLIPRASGPLLDSQVCLFTNTPDHHFLIDAHPEHPQLLVCSPCSGHGFKFASVIGEIVADLLLEGEARFDLDPFRLGRLVA